MALVILFEHTYNCEEGGGYFTVIEYLHKNNTTISYRGSYQTFRSSDFTDILSYFRHLGLDT